METTSAATRVVLLGTNDTTFGMYKLKSIDLKMSRVPPSANYSANDRDQERFAEK